MKAYPALASRIRQQVGDLQHGVDRARVLLIKADTRSDPDYLDGVALALYTFYTGVEHILEAVAREVDGSVPGGPEWHRDLLSQMTGEIDGTRPPVLSADTRDCLDDFRGFRHVVRNVYSHNLDLDRVRQLAARLPDCYEAVSADLRTFADFLNSLQ